MIREPVRAYLAADAALMATLVGGLYPEATGATAGQGELTREGTPAAFDEFGDVKVAGLVVEDATIPFGPPHGTQALFRVLVYQRRGRDGIDAANRRVFALLNRRRLDVGYGFIYEIRFAGFGPQARDQALRDAELGWSRWQAVQTLR